MRILNCRYLSTPRQIKSLFRHRCQLEVSETTAVAHSSAPISEYLNQCAWPQKCLSAGGEICVVDIRIADRMISTIQVISCVATIVVTGLILTMVGTSIYGIL